MRILSEQELKLIDVAKHVADMFAEQPYSGENIEAMKTRTDRWTEIFDRTYRATKATVEEREAPSSSEG